MDFKLHITSENQAMVDEDGRESLAVILEQAAEQLREGFVTGYPRDYNGNVVGFWEFIPSEEG